MRRSRINSKPCARDITLVQFLVWYSDPLQFRPPDVPKEVPLPQVATLNPAARAGPGAKEPEVPGEMARAARWARRARRVRRVPVRPVRPGQGAPAAKVAPAEAWRVRPVHPAPPARVWSIHA